MVALLQAYIPLNNIDSERINQFLLHGFLHCKKAMYAVSHHLLTALVTWHASLINGRSYNRLKTV